MEYSSVAPVPEPELLEAELKYACGSLYDRFQGLSDPRKAKGKRYSLLTLLIVICLAKLCGQDKPGEIADWAQNHADTLVRLLHLRRTWMPHHNTIRRVFQAIISETELEQVLEAYHQQPGERLGEILALDGKALKGTRRADQERCEYVVSVYDGQTQRVLVQEVVETKENEIVAAPQALARVPLAGKTVTGDAIHAQRGLSAYIVAQGGDYLWPVKANQPQLYQDIERLFTPNGRSRVLARSRPTFSRLRPPTAAMAGWKSARSKRVKCSMTISIGQASARSIGSNASLAGCVRAGSTKPALKLNGV